MVVVFVLLACMKSFLRVFCTERFSHRYKVDARNNLYIPNLIYRGSYLSTRYDDLDTVIGIQVSRDMNSAQLKASRFTRVEIQTKDNVIQMKTNLGL